MSKETNDLIAAVKDADNPREALKVLLAGLYRQIYGAAGDKDTWRRVAGDIKTFSSSMVAAVFASEKRAAVAPKPTVEEENDSANSEET